ncbi:MAG: penicillin-binding transpeptidase domain-containing protein [Actinobacteria bacterium]|nr:penicillin-binding transpeptidase domain-containing protein [Actinomycetota bacterium]
MNERIRRMTALLAGLFVILAGQLAYLQVVAANRLVADENNGRALVQERRFRRGAILSAEGHVVAESRASSDGFDRRYPLGDLFANVAGFSSDRYGRSGIELSANEYLMTRLRASSLREYINQLAGGELAGDDIYLTVSERLQEIATRALGKRKGAVVALDPETGDLLALVSYPTYDSNKIDSAFASLRSDPDAPLINRATQGLYPPGSTFKIVTAAAALEKGVATPGSIYDGPAELYVSGGKVVNFDSQELGRMTLDKAFAGSVNTVFAKIGLDVGDDLVGYAQRFGFGQALPIRLPASTSRIPSPGEMDKLALAWTSVGQAQLEATPMQMALVASGIANKGKIMAPRLIREARSPEGAVRERFAPTLWRQAVSEKTAKTLTTLMADAVEGGTGRAARIPGVKVAGKTGTAETASGAPHAWFVGFAPADSAKIAVAVIVENGGLGGKTAAPVARQVIEAALAK